MKYQIIYNLRFIFYECMYSVPKLAWSLTLLNVYSPRSSGRKIGHLAYRITLIGGEMFQALVFKSRSFYSEMKRKNSIP